MGDGVGPAEPGAISPGQRTLALEPVTVTPEMEAEAEKAPEPEMDEDKMFRALRAKFPSDQYALLRHVGNGTGYEKSYRWADGFAMGLWPSRGLPVHGIEIKVSRSDWLAELKQPEKADEIAQYCDFWWLAVPGEKNAIVRSGELPSGWGLIRWKNGKWVTDRVATQLPTLAAKERKLPTAFVAAVLRRAQEQLPAETLLAAEHRRGRIEGISETRDSVKEEHEKLKGEIEAMREAIRQFEKDTGIDISAYSPESVREIGKLVRQVQKKGAPFFRQKLSDVLETAVRIAKGASAELGHLDGTNKTCPCVETSWRGLPERDCEKCHGIGFLPREEGDAPVDPTL